MITTDKGLEILALTTVIEAGTNIGSETVLPGPNTADQIVRYGRRHPRVLLPIPAAKDLTNLAICL